MDDLKTLGPETRAFALIGRFLHQWATMEAALHECIQVSFRLTPTMRDIICANLGVWDKVNILRTVVDVTNVDKAKYRKLLRRVGNYSGRRNTVAHDPFRADPENKGVQFTGVKAKGTYDARPVTWTTKRFDDECKLIEGLKAGLIELKEQLAQNPISDSAVIPTELMARTYLGRSYLGAAFLGDREHSSYYGPPTRRIMSSALADHLSHQTQAHPDSGQASEETSPQNPDTPPDAK